MSLSHALIRFLSLFAITCLGLVACDQGGEPQIVNPKPTPSTGGRSSSTGGMSGQSGGTTGQTTERSGGQVVTGSGGRLALGGQVGGAVTSGGQTGTAERDAGLDSLPAMDTSRGRPDGLPPVDTRWDTRNPVMTGGQAGSFGAGGAVGTGGVVMSGGTTGTCEFPDPPSNIAAWVEESWKDQLGNNVKSRKAWLLDSVMLGKGQINLCVRWGASTAPSAAVKTGIAPSVQKWFNDWFQALGSYGCFPYGSGNVVAKVTGWAVKPGNTDWVSDLGPDVKVYTETDGEGEPKCPDNCSFFTTSNWSHSFPKCTAGEAFHTDYWIWLDDRLPGGGAAAVGGDWGLRMPVSNFVNSIGKGNGVIEHEMGHGFGFQDYYTWTGSRPAGGSIMIVGSGSGSTPTVGDGWLLRRTWKEVKALRNW